VRAELAADPHTSERCVQVSPSGVDRTEDRLRPDTEDRRGHTGAEGLRGRGVRPPGPVAPGHRRRDAAGAPAPGGGGTGGRGIPGVRDRQLHRTAGCQSAGPGVAEAGAWMLAPARRVMRGERRTTGAASFYVRAPGVGYVIAPSAVARHRRTVGDTQSYDVTYRTDEWGRRATPTKTAAARASFLLFFGDSNTFGEGLSQTETLPYYAGERATAWRPYNYGVSGYGPAQLLALARSGRLRQEVPEPDGYALFFLIPAHVGRVVGSSTVSTGWGRHFPYYEVDD